MSSCHSPVKNCSGFLLHPISCCSIGPTLSVQSYFSTSSQLIASPQTELVASFYLPTLIMTVFPLFLLSLPRMLSFFSSSPFFYSVSTHPPRLASNPVISLKLSPARPFLPIPSYCALSPVHLIELPCVHY